MLPLSGLRILSAEAFGAGPYGSMFLADLGAEVIKIENPASGGDASRSVGPHFLGPNDSQFFQTFGTNKRSLTLNLRSPEGQEILHRVVSSVDAIMNNLRGDQPAKLGLEYAKLKSANPKLVCAHLSAYGRDNDRTGWPGYDYLMQAEAGFLSVTGEPGTPPARFGLSIVDFMSGITCGLALLAAIIGAQKSGEGGDIDVCLFDVALHQLSYPATWYLNAGDVTGRLPRGSHPSTVPVQLFKTKDAWIFVMCMLDKFWDRLLQDMGREDLGEHPHYRDVAARREHRDELTEVLDAEFSKRTTEDWLGRLTGKLPVAPVYDLPQALDNPFVQQVQMLQTVPHPHKSDLRLLSNPIRLNGERLPARPCSPLGGDTDELLAEIGYGDDDIADLRSRGVV